MYAQAPSGRKDYPRLPGGLPAHSRQLSGLLRNCLRREEQQPPKACSLPGHRTRHACLLWTWTIPRRGYSRTPLGVTRLPLRLNCSPASPSAQSCSRSPTISSLPQRWSQGFVLMIPWALISLSESTSQRIQTSTQANWIHDRSEDGGDGGGGRAGCAQKGQEGEPPDADKWPFKKSVWVSCLTLFKWEKSIYLCTYKMCFFLLYYTSIRN